MKKTEQDIPAGVFLMMTLHGLLTLIFMALVVFFFVDNLRPVESDEMILSRLKFQAEFDHEQNDITEKISALYHLRCYYYKLGAITYIVCGNKETGGYHSYFEKNGIIYGEIGAIVEVVINSQGNIATNGGFKKLSKNKSKNLY